jgi:hypothetical protein
MSFSQSPTDLVSVVFSKALLSQKLCKKRRAFLLFFAPKHFVAFFWNTRFTGVAAVECSTVQQRTPAAHSIAALRLAALQ